MSNIIKKFREKFCEETFGSEEKNIPHYYLKYSVDNTQIEQFLQQSEQEIRNEICEKITEATQKNGNGLLSRLDVIKIIKSKE
jgi:hypothetical protein